MNNVCIIADDFTRRCLSCRPEIFSIDLDSENGVVDSSLMLFVESAWQGPRGRWYKKISQKSKDVVDLIYQFRSKSKPTVFWCKEDPVHFHRFLDTASEFDFVFTSDINCISLYKQLLGHTRVYLLPFAFQPKINNPIEQVSRKLSGAFAGSYYARYPQRMTDFNNIFAGVSSICNVEIYDRYHGSQDINYKFPDQYQPYIKGSLAPEQIDIAYKSYTFGINLNTVKNSDSMFARRIFELIGSGTVTISNESSGIQYLFGDLVITSDKSEEIRQRLEALVNNSVKRSKIALAGLRKVLLEHTYAHRLERVYSIVLSHPEQKQNLPTVCVVVSVRNLEELQRIQQMLLAQEKVVWRAVFCVSESSEITLMEKAVNDQRIRCIPEYQTEQCMDIVLEDAQWCAGWHANDYYGPNYLLDLILGTRYCDAAVLGKSAMFCADASGTKWLNQEAVYRPMAHVQVRSAVFKAERLQGLSVADWIALVSGSRRLPDAMADGAMALDAFSYCQDAWLFGIPQTEVSAVVDDLELNKGHNIDELYAKAETLPVNMPSWLGKPAWRLEKLAETFGSAGEGEALKGTLDKFGWHLVSDIPDGNYATIWAEHRVPVDELGGSSGQRFHVVEGPGLPVDLLVRFESEGGKLLADRMFETNQNQEWEVPHGASHIRLGFRVFSSGTTRIMRFALTWF